MQCLFTARTFQESGAVVTDRLTIKRKSMEDKIYGDRWSWKQLYYNWQYDNQ